jgi:phage shock protein A
MEMGFMSRLATLARADAHGVVDALEDKSLVLRQQLREAGAELNRKRCRIEALAAEDQDLEAEAGRIAEQTRTLEADVTLALGSGKEELARFAIRKLLPLRHRAAEIEHRRQELGRQRGELEERLAGQETEYTQLEHRVRGYLAQLERERETGVTFRELVVADEDVEIELLRRRQAAEKGGA